MRWFWCVLLATTVLCGCGEFENTWDRWFGDDDDEVTEVVKTEPTEGDDEPETEPEAEDKPVPEPEPALKTIRSKAFHHYNPKAWDGKGVALVLCPDSPRMDACEINGDSMYLHGNRDKGRYVWTRRGETRISGTVACRDGRKLYKFKVKGNGGIQYGDCG